MPDGGRGLSRRPIAASVDPVDLIVLAGVALLGFAVYRLGGLEGVLVYAGIALIVIGLVIAFARPGNTAAKE